MSKPPQRQSSSNYPDVIIEGHDYDGIKEYDNPMPAWWLWIFYATIAWSVFYIAALGAGWIDDYDAQLERGVERIAEKRAAHAEAYADAAAVEVDEEYLANLVEDEEALATGQRAYQMRCATCHGAQGEGGIGPAFDDDQWQHGDSLMEQYINTRDGIPAVGMPPHDALLNAEELAAVTAYIQTF